MNLSFWDHGAQGCDSYLCVWAGCSSSVCMSRSLSVSALPLKDEVDTFLLEVEITKIVDDLNNLVY